MPTTTIPAPTKLKITKITAAAAAKTTCLRNDESLFYLSACVSICTSSQYILLFIIFNGKNWRPNNVLFLDRLDAAGRADWSMRARTRFTSQRTSNLLMVVWLSELSCLFCVYEKNFDLKTSNPPRTATKQLDKNKKKVRLFVYVVVRSRITDTILKHIRHSASTSADLFSLVLELNTATIECKCRIAGCELWDSCV